MKARSLYSCGRRSITTFCIPRHYPRPWRALAPLAVRRKCAGQTGCADEQPKRGHPAPFSDAAAVIPARRHRVGPRSTRAVELARTFAGQSRPSHSRSNNARAYRARGRRTVDFPNVVELREQGTGGRRQAPVHRGRMEAPMCALGRLSGRIRGQSDGVLAIVSAGRLGGQVDLAPNTLYRTNLLADTIQDFVQLSSRSLTNSPREASRKLTQTLLPSRKQVLLLLILSFWVSYYLKVRRIRSIHETIVALFSGAFTRPLPGFCPCHHADSRLFSVADPSRHTHQACASAHLSVSRQATSCKT